MDSQTPLTAHMHPNATANWNEAQMTIFVWQIIAKYSTIFLFRLYYNVVIQWLSDLTGTLSTTAGSDGEPWGYFQVQVLSKCWLRYCRCSHYNCCRHTEWITLHFFHKICWKYLFVFSCKAKNHINLLKDNTKKKRTVRFLWHINFLSDIHPVRQWWHETRVQPHSVCDW